MALKETSIKEWIKRQLGSDVLCIELSPKQIDDAINGGIRWFSARQGVYRRATLAISAGVQEYDLTALLPSIVSKIINVVKLVLPATGFDSLQSAPSFLDMDGLQEADIPGAGRLNYSNLVQRMQMTEMSKRILGADIDFEYDQAAKILTLMPAPSSGGTAIIEYSKEMEVTDVLGPKDEEIYLEACLAFAKRIAGRIRSKYSDVEVAGGSKSLDGDTLLQEARDDLEQLERRIFAKPIPFITG